MGARVIAEICFVTPDVTPRAWSSPSHYLKLTTPPGPAAKIVLFALVFCFKASFLASATAARSSTTHALPHPAPTYPRIRPSTPRSARHARTNKPRTSFFSGVSMSRWNPTKTCLRDTCHFIHFHIPHSPHSRTYPSGSSGLGHALAPPVPVGSEDGKQSHRSAIALMPQPRLPIPQPNPPSPTQPASVTGSESSSTVPVARPTPDRPRVRGVVSRVPTTLDAPVVGLRGTGGARRPACPPPCVAREGGTKAGGIDSNRSSK